MAEYGINKNCEGYSDPTAFQGIKNATQAANDPDAVRVSRFIGSIRDLAALSGFDIMNRIVLRDQKTGREFR